jgi:DNA polymerase III epsilon subunit-like protein
LYHSHRQYARPSRAKASAAKDALLDTLSTRFPKAYLQKVVDKMPDVKPLDFKAGPMVWIDLEMTGLVPSKDKILEIAVSAKSSKHAERD